MERAGVRLLADVSFWAADGTVHDRFVQLTEGLIPGEELGDEVVFEAAELAGRHGDALDLRGAGFRLSMSIEGDDHVCLELEAGERPLRVGCRWQSVEGERFTGLGARHGESFDQTGRRVQAGADRRYTGPDCPAEMLEVGGIPQADCAPATWVVSSRGYGIWLETGGAGAEFDLASADERLVAVSGRSVAGPLRLHVLTSGTPAALLRHYCALTGFPALLPEWAYGHWKSRDVYEHADDVVDDFEGYLRNELPLDAIVLDSPWETQYNTWEFNPEQFPHPERLIKRMRDEGVRTVVWVTPWVNLDSSEGQRPPDVESERMHKSPARNYAPAAEAGHFIRGADGEPFVTRWWMGTGSPVDFTSPAAEEWWRGLARRVLRMGVEGIKADDGDGWYIPPDARFSDGRSGAEAAWHWGGLYRDSMQRALDEEHPGRGVLFGRSGWSGQQRTGILWGGDQASDFWSLRTLVTATLTAAASGFSNWSHDIGGYLGHLLVERCPKELLLRWVQFGCFTPLMHAHGRFAQEAWTYDGETLDVYRSFIVLHEQLVPYVRGAAATAARTGVPIVRPLCLFDPTDPRGWTIADAYGYGPALWVAPVLEDGARERRVYLPRGDWIDFWTHERVHGGVEIEAAAPLDRIPVWVRSGSLVTSYPREEVASGLGDVDPATRPIDVTLWGEPPLGHTGAYLADGTRIRWRGGELSVTPERATTFRQV